VGSAYEELGHRLAIISNLNRAAAVLGWDMQVYMPPAGVKQRGEQLAELGRITHEMLTGDEMGRLLERAESETASMPYESDQASVVRVTRRDYERQRRIPTELVVRMRKHGSAARPVWVEARKTNDFASFAPHLRNSVGLSREMAEAIGYEDRPYDALVGTSDPGLTTADLEQIFGDLRREQVAMVKAVSGREQVDDSCLWQPYDEVKQEEFGVMVVKDYGYSFDRGRLDRTVHPFAISFGPDDVRITTRYNPRFFNMAFFGTLHESGHAMYEQGIGRGLNQTPLSRGASGGFHESQSRLWENLVGRSRPFWQHYYPKLQKLFPQQLDSVDMNTFYKAVNKVQPSLIRVEADEMTYNMHIMLRFELEKDMLEGRLKVEDAPEAWRSKIDEFLGVTPPDDTQGVLQDIHWSGGMGGFPNYALGNVFGAQIWEKALSDKPSIPDEIAHGQFSTLLGWLQENVYQHGRKFETKELMERVTGKPISTASYLRYLRTKFGEIYGNLESATVGS
jgi:carboxypeptidase Taq